MQPASSTISQVHVRFAGPKAERPLIGEVLLSLLPLLIPGLIISPIILLVLLPLIGILLLLSLLILG